jgi:hypothetical protein
MKVPGRRDHTDKGSRASRVLISCVFAILITLPAIAQKNAALRYEIDAKRLGVDLGSDEAAPRSREFLRIDSTYYVGWLYDGASRFNRAADYIGYRSAIAPLERCVRLLERDYRMELSTRTHDLLTYINIYKRQGDYGTAVQYLLQCYANTEDPQSAYNLLRRYLRWNFQRDFVDVYSQLMWVTHRNRFYTRERYPFLRNSIDENERLASAYLDSGMRRIARASQFNTGIFQPGSYQQEYLGLYHYRAILYSYAFQADSAQRYYDLLREGRQMSHNNYGSFRATLGDFKTAEEEYRIASMSEAGDKRLQEWAYYSSILDIYKALPKTGMELSQGMIQSAGSTPGFGWYNIALARCLLYDGQITEAERIVEKAAKFKELHIGTTLGQTHYDFSVQLIKLAALKARVQMIRFENADWWYNPNAIGQMIRQRSMQALQQFLIINQFAQNPERDRVIYKLFSTESTVSWDEIWTLISDFSTQYFVDRFSKELQTDKRPRVRKYFQYFIARLRMKQGKWDEAYRLLEGINRSGIDLDPQYEKLFLARLDEAMAITAQELNKKGERDAALSRVVTTYPQLVPYSGLRPILRLRTGGAADETLLKRLRACNILFAETAGAPTANMVFSIAGSGTTRIEYWVDGPDGKAIVSRQRCSYKTANAERAGIDMAYRLFGVNGL